jgi:hypothetical protein
MNIFRRETDAQHPISMSEIKKKLAKHLSNHEPDRKAIYDDFDALEAYGFIVHREPNGKRYYLENPDFTYNEVRMIADCVSASKFLSERQARNLIEKLKGLCTVYDSSKLTLKAADAAQINDSVQFVDDGQGTVKVIGISKQAEAMGDDEGKLFFLYFVAKENASQKSDVTLSMTESDMLLDGKENSVAVSLHNGSVTIGS